jgi:TfoX/Sxy family transcriptional regulator of competence genes
VCSTFMLRFTDYRVRAMVAGYHLLGKEKFFKIFISNQNYIRFYKLICCDSE